MPNQTDSQWPKDQTPIYFPKMSRAGVEAIKFAFNLERKNQDTDIPVRLDVDTQGCGPGSYDLSVEGMAYHKERDRDPLTVIVGYILHLGIEQGIRMGKQDSLEAFKKRMADLDLQHAKDLLRSVGNDRGNPLANGEYAIQTAGVALEVLERMDKPSDTPETVEDTPLSDLLDMTTPGSPAHTMLKKMDQLDKEL